MTDENRVPEEIIGTSTERTRKPRQKRNYNKEGERTKRQTN